MNPSVTIQRRGLLQTSLSAALLASIGSRAFAVDASVDAVRVVCGFPGGSSADLTSRKVAERLTSDGFAGSAVVENKAGAGGQLAVQFVKGQAPDGRTLLLTPMSMLGIYPHTYQKLPYDPVNDVVPVSMGSTFEFGIAVGPAVPDAVKTVKDYLQWAKGDPKQAVFGGPAAGASPHFIGVLLGRSAGVDLTHVAYRGSVPAFLDVLSGQIPAAVGPIGDAIRHTGQPKYRVLASTGAARSTFAPDVPTLNELGFKDMVFNEWYGFFLPRGATPELIQKMSTAIKKAVEHPDTIKSFALLGLESKSSSPAELGALLKRDTARWATIVKAIGFTADS
jgi:tripartite-type tricarboxylate transporter receptor subunit TctC